MKEEELFQSRGTAPRVLGHTKKTDVEENKHPIKGESDLILRVQTKKRDHIRVSDTSGTEPTGSLTYYLDFRFNSFTFRTFTHPPTDPRFRLSSFVCSIPSSTSPFYSNVTEGTWFQSTLS